MNVEKKVTGKKVTEKKVFRKKSSHVRIHCLMDVGPYAVDPGKFCNRPFNLGPD